MSPYQERGNGFPRTIGEFKTRLAQCDVCGYTRYDPLPSSEDLDTYYQAEYAEVSASVYDLEIQYNRLDLDAVAQHIIDTVRQYGYNGPDTIEAHDVGCAMGMLVYILRKHGVNATGNELNRGWVELGNQLCGGALSSEPFGKLFKGSSRKLHFASYLHTLEHMPNPLDELLEMRLRLHPEGIIYICVPNGLFLPALTFGKESDENFVFPGHLHYYTPKSMSCLLRAAGLKIMHLETRASHFTPNGKDALMRAATGLDSEEVLDEPSITQALAANFRTAELHVIATRDDRPVAAAPVMDKIDRSAPYERPFWRRVETAVKLRGPASALLLVTERPLPHLLEWSPSLRALNEAGRLLVDAPSTAPGRLAAIQAEQGDLGQIIVDKKAPADWRASFGATAAAAACPVIEV